VNDNLADDLQRLDGFLLSEAISGDAMLLGELTDSSQA
jgi:hypothetical protein